ncbi:transcriptional regulatory protein [Laccaria bicolor S238N-H82]|uniref:Transcription activator of gluconeogenesis ERT1 n=1 Tax=Laccaria bicolor (strain S238N-H82 / ATCC MYA-4686) TaxID=486041 RepID=ERT1_LACBS|nr:transcriptional regulatory protein [Laccaria bicolor S238N-H82]B0D0T8.1 RecName: Full=Transcription activator of gluconeogenesis ERT1 [Laccaria bicolor S238N-H82]EDR11520.1 transcriptional regulatory protein [Laccaria bicolor S238N-H82]|eukprot:XP_001877417.1 transcriptional regulatory protein [Laccaria bicolor S238N-H82]
MSAVYTLASRPPRPLVPPSYVNPAQMQNAQAGPSTAPSGPKKKSSPTLATVKRKRTDTPEGNSPGSPSPQPQRKGREGPKKKKANRACFHCQKAHLTCDDSRPCQRCVKRGLASNCTEGHRKKAKYLLDEEELEQLKRSKSSAPEIQGNVSAANTADPPSVPIAEPFPQNDSLLTASFDPNFSFGSEAANREYSILSAILGNPSPPESASTPPPPPPPPQSYATWTSDAIDFIGSPRLGTATSSYTSPYGESMQADTTLSTSPGNAHYLTYPYPQSQRSEDLVDMSYASQYSSAGQGQPCLPANSRPRSPPTVFLHNPSSKDQGSRGLLSPPPSNGSPSSTSSAPSGIAEIVRPQSCGSQLQSINDRVLTPYDYTEGYHFLMKHLPTRFEKNDILRIVRALAIFRPSLIALQMPLSLDDEVFVEKCFQRSLVELDKLMSFSGTPTVVWRRTGEICLVAPEFCMLTEWPMEDLVHQKKYIYELFENQSVVEYWENFASHAFENTTQSVYSHCVLLKPSGAPVPSTFCFSIRRDLFDLPSIVIGQWLPLL